MPSISGKLLCNFFSAANNGGKKNTWKIKMCKMNGKKTNKTKICEAIKYEREKKETQC